MARSELYCENFLRLYLLRITCDWGDETAKFRANRFINTRDIDITKFGLLSPKPCFGAMKRVLLPSK